jgi:hypothetical protein
MDKELFFSALGLQIAFNVIHENSINSLGLRG